ncbi:MAG: DUF3786 domain-containing protein [Deltaproteobacteria bacterium]|jgi:hypothetical protein|nr:DUF3786 domain-containing protein [Deltaproteobacteria bacterium]
MSSPAADQEVFCPFLWADLASLDPLKVADLTGAEARGAGYELNFLGRNHLVETQKKLLIGPPDLREVGFLKTMVVLSYLVKGARGPAPGLANVLVGPWELPTGNVFFRGPHALPTERLAETFGQDPGSFVAKAQNLGAEATSASAILLRPLPYVKLGCYLTPADEEFPAQISWSFDRNAHFYLALDALWGLAHIFSSELTDAPTDINYN